MKKKTFVFEVHCRNANQTRNVIDCPKNELFIYNNKYNVIYDYFASYLDDVEDGPHSQFKADYNNPYSSHSVDEFEEYLYNKQDGIYIQFNVYNGKITIWTWNDMPNEKYKCLEYDDFMIMIEHGIYKSDSIEKIITSDIVDKHCTKSNTKINNITEDITIKSIPEVNFDILFDYGTLLGIGDRFVRKSDISAFIKEECDGYSSLIVVLKSGVKLTFHDIDYDEFVDELDRYYRFKSDIFG